MGDLRLQRNLAIAVALLLAVVVAGVALMRSPRDLAPDPIVRDGESAEESAGTPASSDLPLAAEEETEVEATEPRPAGARSQPARRESPVAGTRAAQPDRARVSEPAPEAPVESAPREPIRLTVADGTPIRLALTSGVSSQTSGVGDRVEAELSEAVLVDGQVALPQGALLSGRVTEAVPLRKVGGRSRLALAFESVRIDGRDVPIAAFFAREGKSETPRDTATIVAGTAIGTILGNQAKKNDRGKIIGGVVGAAAGTAVAAATEGEQIELPAGTELRLTLREPVVVER
jgi:hypothetical protein